MLTTSAPALTGTTAPAPKPATMRPVPWADLTPHRGYLLAYARRRLQDPALAEDLVHDVFEAVATGRAHFAELAALRTWLVGILKHKIVDQMRQRLGHDSLDADHDDDNTGIDFGQPALACPQPRPDEVAEQRQRLAQTMRRIAALPPTLRRAVELRLLHDRPTAEVCSALHISAQNLFVRLHRARRALAS